LQLFDNFCYLLLQLCCNSYTIYGYCLFSSKLCKTNIKTIYKLKFYYTKINSKNYWRKKIEIRTVFFLSPWRGQPAVSDCHSAEVACEADDVDSLLSGDARRGRQVLQCHIANYTTRLVSITTTHHWPAEHAIVRASVSWSNAASTTTVVNTMMISLRFKTDFITQGHIHNKSIRRAYNSPLQPTWTTWQLYEHQGHLSDYNFITRL